MSPILIATLGGLGTAICWGVTDWLTAKTSKKQSAVSISFVVEILGVLFVGAYMLISPTPMPTAEQWLIILGGSALIYVAYLTFIKALSSGVVGIVVPLGNTYPLITLVLSIVFLGQVFESLQIVAMVSIVSGAALLAYEKNHNKIPIKELHRESFMALAASAMWGVGFFVINPLVDDLSWQVLLGSMTLVAAAISVVILTVMNARKTIRVMGKALSNKHILLIALMANLGAISFYFGSEAAGSIIIPTVLSAGAPLVASALGAFVDGEKIGFAKRLGAVVVVAGIIILNVSG